MYNQQEIFKSIDNKAQFSSLCPRYSSAIMIVILQTGFSVPCTSSSIQKMKTRREIHGHDRQVSTVDEESAQGNEFSRFADRAMTGTAQALLNFDKPPSLNKS
jgi:hypothetical protein